MTRSLAPIRSLSSFAVAVAVAASACGGEPAPDRPDPRTCSHAWEVVYSPAQTALSPFSDNPIRIAGGRVYVNVSGIRLSTDELLSFPLAGGEVSQVRSGYTEPFWIEGERLLFVAVAGVATFYSQPIAGGEPEALFTVGDADANRVAYRLAWALDRDALYWATYDFESVKFWHHPRAGGEDRELATLSDSDDDTGGLVERMEVVGDELYVLAHNALWIVPKNGGAARRAEAVDVYDDFLGIAPDGTTLWRRLVSNDDYPKYGVFSLRAGDSEVVPLWSTAAPGFFPMQAWADGVGGWFVAASEDGTDGGRHLTISTLDGDGAANRIACDPLVDSYTSSGAATADGVHVIFSHANSYWEIAAVSRPAPGAGSSNAAR